MKAKNDTEAREKKPDREEVCKNGKKEKSR